MRHLRLVEDEPPLFEAPRIDVYPADLRQLTDQLHDRGLVELGQAILVQHTRLERLLRVAQTMLESNPNDAA